MNCADVTLLLEACADQRLSAGQEASVDAHLAACGDCRAALEAMRALRRERLRPVPAPRPDLFTRTMWRATSQAGTAHAEKGRSRFWMGVTVGGALAAGVVLAVLGVGTLLRSPATDVVSEMTIAMDETRDVSIAIDSPSDVEEAQIRVVLTGAIALAGFEGQDELRWATQLDRGVNMLKLPVTMRGRDGGHLLVEVSYGAERKTLAVRLQEEVRMPRGDTDPV